MINYHDPIKHIKILRQTLSQDKKPIGFLFLLVGNFVTTKKKS